VISEEEALEENLITRFANIQAMKGQCASNQSVRVRKLSAGARMPTRGSGRAAGHDLYANEGTKVPARGQAIIGTGIAIGVSHNTCGRIAPRSSPAEKYQLMPNARMIDTDCRGEVKVLLANLVDQLY